MVRRLQFIPTARFPFRGVKKSNHKVKMSKIIFVVSVAVFVTVLISRDAMSAPQMTIGGGNGTTIGGGNGTTIGGGDGTTIGGGSLGGGGGNGNSSLPGSGYPSEYEESHSNDTAPTSPPLGGGSISSGSSTVQDSTSATNICDCNQSGGNDNGNGSGGSDNGNADSGSPVGDNPVESQQ